MPDGVRVVVAERVELAVGVSLGVPVSLALCVPVGVAAVDAVVEGVAACDGLGACVRDAEDVPLSDALCDLVCVVEAVCVSSGDGAWLGLWDVEGDLLPLPVSV